MRYLVAIEPGTRSKAWGVVVPDLPGCFSAGSSLDDALANARAAIESWLESALDNGDALPRARPFAAHYGDAQFRGWVWAAVDIDPARLSDAVERVNITLPSRVLRRIDAAARAADETRSGWLTRRALEALGSMPASGVRETAAAYGKRRRRRQSARGA